MSGPWDDYAAPAAAGPWEEYGAAAPAAPAAKPKGFGADIKTALKAGALEIPGMLTGLADIPAGLAGLDRPVSRLADKAGEATGFQPAKWAQEQQQGYSEATQQGRAEIDQAWEDPNANALDVAGAYARNPRTTALNVVQSLPAMAVGGVGARLLKVLGSGASAVARGAAGEGAVMAGQSMNEIDESVDPQRAAAAAGAVGIGGAALGAAGGRVAQRLGLPDPDTLLAGGKASGAGKFGALPLYKRAPAAMVQEGLLEELPQSLLETGAQNVAEGKPVGEGMARAGTEGALAGAVMGGVVGAAPRSLTTQKPEPTPAPTAPPGGPMERAAALATAVGAKWQAIAPTDPQDDLAGQKKASEVGAQWQGMAPSEPADDLAAQKDVETRKSEEEGAAASRATDARIADVGKQWQDLGITDPATDLQRQRAGMTPAQERGIDADAGPLSSAAASALNTGTTQQLEAKASESANDITDGGKPFAGAIPARRAADKAGEGWSVEKVEGGYVVRPSPEVVKAAETGKPAAKAPDEPAKPAAKAKPSPAPAAAAAVPAPSSPAPEAVAPGPGAASSAGTGADANTSLTNVQDQPSPAVPAAPPEAARGQAPAAKGSDATGAADAKAGAGAAPALEAAGVKPLAVGPTPTQTEPVTVKNGVVHIGKSEALNFESGEPVKVAEGATDAQIKQALKDAGALGKRQRFYGGQEASTTAAPVAQKEDAASVAPTNAESGAASLQERWDAMSVEQRMETLARTAAKGRNAERVAATQWEDLPMGWQRSLERPMRAASRVTDTSANAPGKTDETGKTDTDRPANWRGNFIAASQVAKKLGIGYEKGRTLAQLVALIEAKDQPAEAIDHPYYVRHPKTGEHIGVASPEAAADRFKQWAGISGQPTMDVMDAKSGQPTFNLSPDGSFRKIETREETRARSERQAAELAKDAPGTLPAVRQQLFVQRGQQRFPVESLEDAAAKWDQFRDATGAGVSEIGSSTKIVDQDGKEVARISYNGKVWPPGEWKSDMKPLVGEDFKSTIKPKPVQDDAALPAPAESAKSGTAEPAQSDTARWNGTNPTEREAFLLAHTAAKGKTAARVAQLPWSQLDEAWKRTIERAYDAAPVADPVPKATSAPVPAKQRWNDGTVETRRQMLAEIGRPELVNSHLGIAWDALSSNLQASILAKAGEPMPKAEPKPVTPQVPTRNNPIAKRNDAAEAARAAYFTPGNVVKSYGGFDEVLAYIAPTAPGGAWSVKVHEVKEVTPNVWVRQGKPQDARQHATQPEARELKDGPVARLPALPGVEVPYSAPRQDRQPFTYAPDRGTPAASAPAAAATGPRVVINQLGPDGLTDAERAAGKKPYTDAPKRKPAEVIDNGATNPGEFIVRDAGTNLARFEVSNGKAIKVKFFHESEQTRNHAREAIDNHLEAQTSAPPKPDKAEIRPYRKPDGSVGYEAVPIQARAPVADDELIVQSIRPGSKPEVVKVEPLAPKPTVSKNTVFTDDMAAAARARLKAKLGRPNSGLDPEMMLDGITLAGYHIEGGARTFAAYAKAMIEDMGDAVRPYLKGWYMGVKYDPRAGAFSGDMSSAAFVDEFDFAHIAAPSDGLGVEKPAGKADTGGTDGTGTATRGMDRAGPGSLEGAPAGDVRAPATGGDAGAEPAGSGDGDQRGDADAAAPGGKLAGGLGADAGAVPVPGAGARGGAAAAKKPRVPRAPRSGAGAGRADDAGREGAVAPNAAPPAAPQFKPQDFTIEDDFALGEGGQKTKFRNNVAAIRLLRELEAQDRLATPDEQQVLAKYVGWGGLPQAFDPENKDWAKESAELLDLLPTGDWEQAAMSTRYAHYTSREIIQDGIYAALRHFGFTGGRTLEGGAGVGNFIGLMPVDMRSAGRVTAIEREPIAQGIARHLYPNQSVQRADFTEFVGTDGYFDAAVGNPPFASDPQVDRSGRKHLSGLSLHNYFFAKEVDMLREGGILAQVVTSSFLDAQGDRARKYISERTRFLGAIRLPNNAFSKNAGTEVTTDLIFLQKRPEAEWGSKAAKLEAQAWLGVGQITDPRNGVELNLNQYFIDHPDMMLGDFGAHGTMYGPDQPALVARQGQDTLKLLRAAVQKLPGAVYVDRAVLGTDAAIEGAVKALERPPVQEGGYFVDGQGKLMQRLTDIAGEARGREITAATQWTAKTTLGDAGVARIQALAGLRVTLRSLLAAELGDRAAEATALRKTLNTQYDDYAAAHGLLNDHGTHRVFDDDPDFPLLLSLEHNYLPGMGVAAAKRQGLKPTKSTATKAPIFARRVVDARRTVQKVETPADALAVSMAERGKLDTGYIGQLLGKDPDEVLRELSSGDKPLLFLDPATDEYVLRDAYLSGNVRAKLDQARQAGLSANARELERVIPADKGAHEITARVGSPWVPTEVYEDFAKELFGEGTDASVRYVKLNGAYGVYVTPGSTLNATNKWGIPQYTGPELLAALLNNRTIKVTWRDDDGKTHTNMEATERANTKAQEIRDRFQDWLFADPARSELLVRTYNDTNNNYVTRDYDGAWMTFPGKVPDEIIKFRRHQRNAIARIVQDRTALLDHVVGSGKTFTVVAAAMELRRTGLAKKPMVMVPNHLVKQWAADFYRLYPGANILTATKKDFEKINRRRFLAKIATGDWDAVVIAHSSFGFIRPGAAFEAEFNTRQVRLIMETIQSVENGDGDKQQKKRTVKQLQGMKERLQNRIRALRDKPMDSLLDFEELGVDQLFVDEAHMFKNLMFTTKMQGVQGLGDAKGSQRAYDMYVKSQEVMEKNGRGQGLVFATGTPVSNSLAEKYHMMRYLMPRQMEELGFQSFDAWANTFASVEQVWMQKPSGDGYKASNRMSNFVNVHELLKMFDQVADTVTMDDIKKAFKEENQGREFPIPPLKTGRRQPVSLDKSAAQEAYMLTIAARARVLEQRRGPPQKGEDNTLVIMSDARKAAMDIRLVDHTIDEREKGGRIDRSADEILARYRQFDNVKGTQLVFSDLGTPKKHAKAELKEWQALQARIEAATDEVRERAAFGAEDAQDVVDDAEAAQAELDAQGADWMVAVHAALRGFSVYDDLKDALIERGIPEGEIAFIHDANTDERKAALFRRVNSGAVRVLIGSTAKMGAGTNVQERLVAEHHLDVPWRPSDVEQREGRIERQGNALLEQIPGFEVEILAYVTRDTLDMRMWQIQEVKLKMINQLRTRQIDRDIDNAFEDMEMSAGEMQAAATGNMDLLREIQARAEIKKWEQKRRSFDAQKSDLVNRRASTEKKLATLPARIADAEVLAEAAGLYDKALKAVTEAFTVTIDGQEFRERYPASQYLLSKIDARVVEEDKPAGEDGKKPTRAAPLDLTMNGVHYTARAKLQEAWSNAAGDRDPIAWTFEGQSLNRRSLIATALRQRVADAVADEKLVQLGQVGPFKVSAEGQVARVGKMLDVVLEYQGRTIASQFGVPEGDSSLKLAEQIATWADRKASGAAGELNWLKGDLASAKAARAELDKAESMGEWPEQGKLDAARAEHKAILARLAATAAPADDGTPTGDAAPDAPSLRRSDDPTTLRATEIKTVLADALDALTIPYAIHPTVEAARIATGYRAIPRGVKGAYFKGKLHLVADSIAGPLQAEEVFWHEVNHAGLDAMYGMGSKPYESALRGIALQNANIRQAAKAWFAKYGAEDMQARIDSGATPEYARKRTQLQAIDEALAELSGRQGAKINGLHQWIAAVQRFMRSIGLNRLADAIEGMTDSEALSMIMGARDAVTGRRQARGVGALAPAFSKDEGAEFARGDNPKMSNKAVGEAFRRMVEQAEDDLSEVLFNWEDSRLNEDKDGIVTYPGRDAEYSRGKDGGRVKVSKRAFLDWLASDGPFDTKVYGPEIERDAEWRGQIERLRQIAGLAEPRGTLSEADRKLAAMFGGKDDDFLQFSRAPATDSASFRKWFGSSKVVDAQGRPQRMYHGTWEKNIEAFDPDANGRGAVFFSPDPDHASEYGVDGYTMPVYLSVQNPFDPKNKAHRASLLARLGDSEWAKIDGLKAIDAAIKTGDWSAVEGSIPQLRELGFDGAFVVEDGVRNVAVFSPSQIKSAIGNNGDFDPANSDIAFSRGIVAGATSRVYTARQERGMRNVGFQITPPTVKERAAALWKDAGKKLAQGLVDQFAPVKDLDAAAYGLLRLAKGASGAFETFLHGGKLKLNAGAYDFDETKRGGVIGKLLIPLGGEHHDFMRWVAANRAERLMAEDREHLFSAQDIADLKTLADGTLSFDFTLQHGPRAGQTTRNRTEAYRDSLATFNEFNKNALDMAEQSGLIDPESRKVWEHEFYVPFYRVAEEGTGGVRGMNVKSGVVRQQAFKHLKGGRDALNTDLLDNTLLNWAHLLDAAAKNRAAKATLEAAERMGLALEAPAGDAQQIGASTGNKNGVVWFMDGGLKRFFVVEDPQILTAISGLEFAGMRGPMMDAMGTFKHVLTVGVTASPFFKVRNLIRDSVQVIGTSPIGVNPAANVARGWKLTERGSDPYFRLLAGGGTIHFGTMLEGSEGKRVQALVESGVPHSTILNSDNKLKAFYRQYVEPAVTAYNELGNRGEAINRATLYDQLIRQGVSHADASLQARDLMDFSMQGSFTTIRFLAQTVPFLNARLQGTWKLARAAKENPARFSAVLGSVALVSLALLAAYSDDDDWKKRELWDRQNFWWFKFGGTAFRIPKPFEIGAIASLAEHGAELMFDDEMTGKRFRQAVLKLLGDNLAMNPVPQLVKPMLDVYANTNSFTGRPIESAGMERLQPEYRFNAGTSMLARGASTTMNAAAGLVGAEALSPVQIDHLLRGYFGWLGAFVVGAGDAIARPATGQPAGASPDYWKAATGGMVSDLRDAPSRYVSQMYEQAKAIEQAYGTWRALLRDGKVEEAAAFRAEHQDELARQPLAARIKRGESFLNQQIKRIERSDLPASEKREQIRAIQQRKDRMARGLAPS